MKCKGMRTFILVFTILHCVESFKDPLEQSSSSEEDCDGAETPCETEKPFMVNHQYFEAAVQINSYFVEGCEKDCSTSTGDGGDEQPIFELGSPEYFTDTTVAPASGKRNIVPEGGGEWEYSAVDVPESYTTEESAPEKRNIDGGGDEQPEFSLGSAETFTTKAPAPEKRNIDPEGDEQPEFSLGSAETFTTEGSASGRRNVDIVRKEGRNMVLPTEKIEEKLPEQVQSTKKPHYVSIFNRLKEKMQGRSGFYQQPPEHMRGRSFQQSLSPYRHYGRGVQQVLSQNYAQRGRGRSARKSY